MVYTFQRREKRNVHRINPNNLDGGEIIPVRDKTFRGEQVYKGVGRYYFICNGSYEILSIAEMEGLGLR